MRMNFDIGFIPLFEFLTDGSSNQQDVYYGCPREIFALTSLRRLNLSFQGFVHLSPEIQNLTNLEELILSNNPLLESLPGSVSKLQNLSGKRNINDVE
jgi:Leucine-rich repeat (LRR) protein